MKKAFFVIIGLLILPSFTRADDFVLSGYSVKKLIRAILTGESQKSRKESSNLKGNIIILRTIGEHKILNRP